jgi:hypothetical protein
LTQMVEHEERTHSWAETMSPESVTSSVKKIYSLFVPETSAHTKDTFQRMWQETGTDLIKHAMMAKSSSDWWAKHKPT